MQKIIEFKLIKKTRGARGVRPPRARPAHVIDLVPIIREREKIACPDWDEFSKK
jgi:hypothetical protein